MKIAYFIPFLIVLSACWQTHSDHEEDFRIVPVTNNPNIIPNHGSIPGMR